MSEWTLVLLVFLKMLFLTSFVSCYVIGGRKWKWIRRFVGGFLFSGGCIGFAYWEGLLNIWVFCVLLAYPAILTLGYGGDSYKEKVVRRTLYGLSLGIVAVTVGFLTGNVLLGAIQGIFALSINPILGTANPTNAVYEEALISLLSVAFIPFIV